MLGASLRESSLNELAQTWLRIARRKFQDADFEQNPMGKRLIEHGAVCYFNCARELQKAIQAGDTLPNLSPKVLTQDTERP